MIIENSIILLEFGTRLMLLLLGATDFGKHHSNRIYR